MSDLHWSEVFLELLSFVALFLAAGAVGFRFAAIRGRQTAGPDQAFHRAAARRAAVLGLVGALVGAGLLLSALAEAADQKHTTLAALLGDPATAAGVGLALAIVVGLGLAALQVGAGWWLAGLAVVANALQGITGSWTRLVNPVHSLAASLWLGTLLVLVVAGLAPALRAEGSRRGAVVADLVHGFSPLALTCGLVLVTTGLITAWRHLHSLGALLDTTYGNVLIAKLCVVACVFGLGAWNWRRHRPRLGTEDAGRALQRSALGELAAATLVLAITAVLVSVPSPRPPRPAPAAAR